jgi:hypothetical protein
MCDAKLPSLMARFADDSTVMTTAGQNKGQVAIGK